MSVFKVAINNDKQGLLDTNPATGAQIDPSIQRTIYVAGPNRKIRELSDGDTFTDCNYWKQFAYPQVTEEQAIVEVLSDDGSVWSSVDSENTFPKVYSLSCAGGSTYAANTADILGDTGGYATFVQITNNGSNDVSVKINGLSSAIFTLGNGDTQVFNNGDLTVTQLAIDNSASGAATAVVQIICAVKSLCNS
jgi:hypothetical protein